MADLAEAYGKQFEATVSSGNTYVTIWLTSILVLFLTSVLPLYKTTSDLAPQKQVVMAARRQAKSENASQGLRRHLSSGVSLFGTRKRSNVAPPDIDLEISARQTLLNSLRAKQLTPHDTSTSAADAQEDRDSFEVADIIQPEMSCSC